MYKLTLYHSIVWFQELSGESDGSCFAVRTPLYCSMVPFHRSSYVVWFYSALHLNRGIADLTPPWTSIWSYLPRAGTCLPELSINEDTVVEKTTHSGTLSGSLATTCHEGFAAFTLPATSIRNCANPPLDAKQGAHRRPNRNGTRYLVYGVSYSSQWFAYTTEPASALHRRGSYLNYMNRAERRPCVAWDHGPMLRIGEVWTLRQGQ